MEVCLKGTGTVSGGGDKKNSSIPSSVIFCLYEVILGN